LVLGEQFVGHEGERATLQAICYAPSKATPVLGTDA
jgi:hypothetical protein